jgi:hypothetical protein
MNHHKPTFNHLAVDQAVTVVVHVVIAVRLYRAVIAADGDDSVRGIVEQEVHLKAQGRDVQGRALQPSKCAVHNATTSIVVV